MKAILKGSQVWMADKRMVADDLTLGDWIWWQWKKITDSENPEYELDLRKYHQGKKFPWWKYDRHQWPAPFYQLVTREEALEHCPNCQSFQQFGPRDRFPETYHCGRCGFNGPHPLYGTPV